MSQPVQFHYRAPKCKTCNVKMGLGDCPKCQKLQEELKAVVAAVRTHIEREREVTDGNS